MKNLAKDWPMFILLGGVAVFYLYVIIAGNRTEPKKDEDKNKKKNYEDGD